MLKENVIFLDNLVSKDILEIQYCKIELQLEDILTKPLKMATFYGIKKLMGMRRLGNMN